MGLRLMAPGAVMGLASAILFGASTPFAKLLLGSGIDAWLLAGLLYLGAGGGLAAYSLLRRLVIARPRPETALTRSDLPWLGLVVLAGGIVGPLLLMVGLSSTPASSAALLLNLEGVATLGLAWLVFRESVDMRLLLGAAAILAGAMTLSWQGGPDGFGIGALAIAGACLAWGIDNNLTRKLSAADPLQITMIKGLVAGATNLALAMALGADLPPIPGIMAAGLIGFLGYGVSLVLFVLALRHIGAARTGAYFSTAPFIGAMLAVLVFDEPVTLALIIAGALMGLGVYFHIAERHDHEHSHHELEHAHGHVHDAHHLHAHGPDDPPGEPHTHMHVHAPMVHRHPHFPDIHHRHVH